MIMMINLSLSAILILMVFSHRTVSEWCSWSNWKIDSSVSSFLESKTRHCQCVSKVSTSSCVEKTIEHKCKHPTAGIVVDCSTFSTKSKVINKNSGFAKIRFQGPALFGYRYTYNTYTSRYYRYRRYYYCYSIGCNAGYLSGVVLGTLVFVGILIAVIIILCFRHHRLQRIRIANAGVTVVHHVPQESVTVTQTTVVPPCHPNAPPAYGYGNFNGYTQPMQPSYAGGMYPNQPNQFSAPPPYSYNNTGEQATPYPLSNNTNGFSTADAVYPPPSPHPYPQPR